MPRITLQGCAMGDAVDVMDLNQGDLVVVVRGADMTQYMVTTYPDTKMEMVLFTNLETGDIRRKKQFPRQTTVAELKDFLKADAVEVVDGALINLCINYDDDAVK